MSQTALSKPAQQSKNRLWMPLLGIAALGVGWGGFEFYHHDRILPGISAAGVSIGGQTQEEALQTMRDAKLPVPIVSVRAGDQVTRINASELGWRADTQGMVARAFAIGRDGDTLVNIGKRFAGNKEVPLAAKVDPKTFAARLERLAKPFEVAPKNAALVFANDQYVIRQDVDGQGVDFAQAIDAFGKNPLLTNLELNITDIPAPIQAESLKDLANQANSLLRPLQLAYPTPTTSDPRSRTLSAAEVANLYFVEKTGLRLDENAITEVLRSISKRFDQAPLDARYVRQAGNLVRRNSEDGYALDLAEAKTLLSSAVLDPQQKVVTLPVVLSKPKISTTSIPDPKTLTVLASSTTRYFGSSRERVMNAAIAANKLDGFVVPQGETFSFNSAVGEISAETGFVEGLIISGGRTQKGVGGGVCQASTTTFATLFRAGLPIVERNQHSYKVRWYDDVIGLDAAVYYPTLDLKMQNNTAGPIVIRASTNGATMTVSVLGVSDGRKVAVSSAQILRRTPHPPTRTIFNPRLPAGTSKQVDYAVDGYHVNVVRTINGKSDNLYTVYRPWQAIYEVGPSRLRPAAVRPRQNSSTTNTKANSTASTVKPANTPAN